MRVLSAALLAVAAACGGNVDNAKDCPERVANHTEGCPLEYSRSSGRCDHPGLVCSYPGAGDEVGDGCNATAILLCQAHDGGPPAWVSAQ